MSQLKLEEKQAQLVTQQNTAEPMAADATVHELLDALHQDLRRYAEKMGLRLVAL